MKNEDQNTGVETFRQNISETNANILYSLMLLRISKGYNSADLSFLLGYSFDFFKTVEELKHIGFGAKELYYFTRALGIKRLDGIIFSNLNENHFSDYELRRTTTREKIQHELFRLKDGQNPTMIFSLFEENPDFHKSKFSERLERQHKELDIIFNLLFEGHYFLSPKDPQTLFKKFKRITDYTLHPQQLQEFLMQKTLKKGFPKLKMTTKKSTNCLFEKALRIEKMK